MKTHCAECSHEASRHLTGQYSCLVPGCLCMQYEESSGLSMYSVRIDKDGEKYIFTVESMPFSKNELVALDSTPGVIAFVHAPNPGAGAQRAWEKGQRELASLGGLPPSSPEKLLELLGDKEGGGSNT